MGIFEDLNCDEMTIPQFRKQVELWAANGEVPEADIDYIVAVEEAWREIESGDYIMMTEEEFRKEMEMW